MNHPIDLLSLFQNAYAFESIEQEVSINTRNQWRSFFHCHNIDSLFRNWLTIFTTFIEVMKVVCRWSEVEESIKKAFRKIDRIRTESDLIAVRLLILNEREIYCNLVGWGGEVLSFILIGVLHIDKREHISLWSLHWKSSAIAWYYQ